MYHPDLERAIAGQCADNVVNVAGAGIKFLHLLQGTLFEMPKFGF